MPLSLVKRGKKRLEKEKTVAYNVFSNIITDDIIGFVAASVSMILFHQILSVLKIIWGVVVVLRRQTHLSRGRKEWG